MRMKAGVATLVAATRQRPQAIHSAAGEGSDFVLDAAAKLTPGDSSSLSAASKAWR